MFLSKQSFNELPDNSRVTFTAQIDFVENTLIVTQGALFVENYIYAGDHRSITFDSPPNPENGGLLWAGQTYFGDASIPTQFPAYELTSMWTVADFLLWYRFEPEQFSPRVTFANWDDFVYFIGNVLQQAEEKLKIYFVNSDYYARGVADPVATGDEILALGVKEAIALRAQQIIRDSYSVSSASSQDLKEQEIWFEGAGKTKTVYRNPIIGETAQQSYINLPEMQLFDAIFMPIIGSSEAIGKVMSFSDFPDQAEIAALLCR